MITINHGPKDYVFYDGNNLNVEWYFNLDGRMKAKEYFDSLLDDEQKRLMTMVKYMADSPMGTRFPKTMFNLEDSNSKIYAFKTTDHRFFNFMTEGR